VGFRSLVISEDVDANDLTVESAINVEIVLL
jgi:hypothetical protein